MRLWWVGEFLAQNEVDLILHFRNNSVSMVILGVPVCDRVSGMGMFSIVLCTDSLPHPSISSIEQKVMIDEDGNHTASPLLFFRVPSCQLTMTQYQ